MKDPKMKKDKETTSILEDMLAIKELVDKMRENLEPDPDEMRKERQIQEGIEKQEAEHIMDKTIKSAEELQAIVDNNPDDGSWIGR